MFENRIFIYGVPGVGKTYYSKILGEKLNLPVMEGDTIKRKYRKDKDKKTHPFLYLGTCKAYREFGKLNEENVIKGLIAVREELNKVVLDEIKKHEKLILECAFFNPETLKDLGHLILLITKDENAHRKQFLHHLEKRFDIEEKEFKAARLAQEYLIQEANKLGVEIIDNNKFREEVSTISS